MLRTSFGSSGHRTITGDYGNSSSPSKKISLDLGKIGRNISPVNSDSKMDFIKTTFEKQDPIVQEVRKISGGGGDPVVLKGFKPFSLGFQEKLKAILQSGDSAIPENSTYRKLFACIPAIGIISTILNENSLRKKIKNASDYFSRVELINVMNKYKVCSLIRESLSLAAVVSGVALGILSSPIAFGVAITLVACMSLNGYAIHTNKQTIKTCMFYLS